MIVIVIEEFQSNCNSNSNRLHVIDHMSVRHTCYVATATPNLKDFHNSSQEFSRNEKKMLAFG